MSRKASSKDFGHSCFAAPAVDGPHPPSPFPPPAHQPPTTPPPPGGDRKHVVAQGVSPRFRGAHEADRKANSSHSRNGRVVLRYGHIVVHVNDEDLLDQTIKSLVAASALGANTPSSSPWPQISIQASQIIEVASQATGEHVGSVKQAASLARQVGGPFSKSVSNEIKLLNQVYRAARHASSNKFSGLPMKVKELLHDRSASQSAHVSEDYVDPLQSCESKVPCRSIGVVTSAPRRASVGLQTHDPPDNVARLNALVDTLSERNNVLEDLASKLHTQLIRSVFQCEDLAASSKALAADSQQLRDLNQRMMAHLTHLNQ